MIQAEIVEELKKGAYIKFIADNFKRKISLLRIENRVVVLQQGLTFAQFKSLCIKGIIEENVEKFVKAKDHTTSFYYYKGGENDERAN